MKLSVKEIARQHKLSGEVQFFAEEI